MYGKKRGLSPKLESAIRSDFGKINQVNVGGKTYSSADALIRDIKQGNQDTIQNLRHSEHVVDARAKGSTTESKRQYATNALSSYKTNIQRALRSLDTKRSEPKIKIEHQGWLRETYGDNYKRKNRLPDYQTFINKNKREFLNKVSDDEIINIAKRNGVEQYYELVGKSGLSEKGDKQRVADLIRDAAAGEEFKASGSGKEAGWLKSIVFEAGKRTNRVRPDTNYGSDSYKKMDRFFGKFRSNSKNVVNLEDKMIKKRYGNDSSAIDLLKEVKKETGSRSLAQVENDIANDENTQRIARQILSDKLSKAGTTETQFKAANRTLSKLGIGGPKFEKENLTVRSARKERAQRVELVKAAGLSDNFANDPIGHLLRKKTIHKINTLEHGSSEDIREILPNSVSFKDIFDSSKKTQLNMVKKLIEHDIEVRDLPNEYKDKLSGVQVNSSSKSGKKSSRSSSSFSKGGSRRSGSTAKSGDGWLESEEIKYTAGGRAKIVKHRGKIGQALHNTKSKIPGVGDKKERYRKKKRAWDEEYNRLDDDETLKYLTNDEKRYIAQKANPIEKRNMITKAQRMYYDPAYRAKITAKNEEKVGIYEAKVHRAKREAQQRKKAAMSPWWKAWYAITKNLWVLVGIVAAISIMFIPIGLFFVTGWLIAAGLVSLFMFIIWVFIELWFMIAMALTTVINFIGQAIVMAINGVGATLANALGQEYTPFEHTLVRNMNIAQINPETGQREILGITWGQFNLTPPDFLSLNSFKPTEFDTDTILAKIFPPIRDFFNWYTAPLAQRWTDWIANAEWYTIATVAGTPLVLIIIGVVAGGYYLRRRMI